MSKLFQYFGIKKKEGEYLFKEGDSADYLYLIHKGKVLINRVVRDVEEKIQILSEGEFVGEMAIIDSLPRSANAIAAEDCELIRMDRESFEKNFRENPQLSLTFIQFLSKRIRDTNEIVSVLAEKDRFHSFLMEILKEMIVYGKKDASGNWSLIKFHDFVDHMMAKTDYDEDDIMSIIVDLVEKGDVKIKKGDNNTKWIAYKLQ